MNPEPSARSTSTTSSPPQSSPVEPPSIALLEKSVFDLPAGIPHELDLAILDGMAYICSRGSSADVRSPLAACCQHQ